MEQKYLGITPYNEDGDFEFAGRSEETWALFDRIIRNEYTVYYAASGEGKSSLIRAGLTPILERRNYYPVYIVFEDKELENVSSIEHVIIDRIKIKTDNDNVSYEQSNWSKSRFNAEISEKLKNNLWWLLRNYCFKREDTELKPIFIFDQFEEVFTKANYDWTDRLFAWLEEISTDYLPTSLQEDVKNWGIDVPTEKNFKALFSFRTEYLGDLDYWSVQKHFLPSLQENRMCLKPLTVKGAREVINLNEAALGKYADKIIQGCTEAKTNTLNEDQPCVYALILSVVCQTLSDITDKEREPLLENLKSHQDDTIDDILLRFYKNKLKAAGLDYIKDEKIIAEIEDAFVDEKGKRSRRDTDEPSIVRLSKWISILSSKDNSLLKIIGKKEVNGTIVNTVEFPHDRLCKAINTSRRERQGKIEWKLNRQGEWIQFGVITAIVVIIALLWNISMPSMAPIIGGIIGGNFNDIKEQFLENYLDCQPSLYGAISLDIGFSTLLLMVSLILFIPLITIFISRKNQRSQIFSSIVSLLSTISFAFLLYRNSDIEFANDYVSIFTWIGFLVSIISLIASSFKLRKFRSEEESESTNALTTSNWPLWGGYFIFAGYIFYECLFCLAIGVSEPCDSFWALFALPILFTMWAWGFLNMKVNNNIKKRTSRIYIVSIVFLALLSTISVMPFNDAKQSYGFVGSIILIILWVVANVHILWISESNSHYYWLSTQKRIITAISGALVIIGTFILNLGYNPIKIAPNTVKHVNSWRTVEVIEPDSMNYLRKFGILYATNGDTIIPCNTITKIKRSDAIIERFLSSSPFGNDSTTINPDSSLTWNSNWNTITTMVPTSPTLEQYLHRTIANGVPNNNDLTKSIDYYAANLFSEIRAANINYVLTGDKYNLDTLKSLKKLDSLQHIALSNELKKLCYYKSDSLFFGEEIVTRDGYIKDTVRRIDVLEDRHLIDLHRELSRSFMICLIKDRAIQSDMPTMFFLARLYLITFFTSVPNVAMNIRFNDNFNIQATNNNDTTFVAKHTTTDIRSDDILNHRFFAWYDLFNCLCAMDMAANSANFADRINNINEIATELLATQIDLNLIPSLQTISKKNPLAWTLEEIKVLSDLREQIAHYKVVLDKCEEVSSIRQVEQSIQQLKDDVFSTLIPVMKEKTNGIYNNDFETICRNLILVSSFRGYDTNKDKTMLSEYLTCKTAIADAIQKVNNWNPEFQKLIHDVRQSTERAYQQVEERLQQKIEIDSLWENVQALLKEKEEQSKNNETQEQK